MRNILLLLILGLSASAQKSRFTPISTVDYPFPDTLKVAQYYTEFSVNNASKGFYGISFSKGSLGLEKKGKRKNLVFILDSISDNTRIIANGLGTRKSGRQTVFWKYNWQQNQFYKLLVTTLIDSASHASFYTGYVFLPEEKQWKFIASFKTTDGAQYLKQPASTSPGKSKRSATPDNQITVQEAWVQRSNGSWKNLLTASTGIKPPVFSVTNQVDSTSQAAIDKREIINSTMDTMASSDNVYYLMIREGKDELVKLTDTVSVYYKGWLLKDGTIFDQTKDKPAKFALARLIKGWQLGLVNCRVGGKIRMLIPSGLAYSIRSRSKDIPPNSVLVFEVEVLEAKAAG